MGTGNPDIGELETRHAERRADPVTPIASTPEVKEKMIARGIVARECLASDDSPHPLPIQINIDTTTSMGHVPKDLATGSLPRLLVRLTEMGSVGKLDPQLCFCGVADTDGGTDAFRFGQFERDNRMDIWLTGLCEPGHGGGSEYLHESYNLAMYAADTKVKADIWKHGKKGYLFIAGDEMCPETLNRRDVERIFGDHIPHDLTTTYLLRHLEAHWHIRFVYVATGFYESNGGNPGATERIWQHWQERLGKHALRLDAKGTGLPELIAAVIGIEEGHFAANDAPRMLTELGCDAEIVQAVANALHVPLTGPVADTPKPRKRGPTAR